MAGNWLTIEGHNILGPDGKTFYPNGSNSRWNYAKDTDGVYLSSTIGANMQRIEFHWLENGVAGDARLTSAPGHIDPAQLALLQHYVNIYAAAGIRVDLAIHSSCGRSGTADDDNTGGNPPGTGNYCFLGDNPANWLNGRNFWSDPALRQEWLEMLGFLAAFFAGNPMVSIMEPLNEPDPPNVSDAAVASLLWQAADVIHAANPNVLVMLGGNGGYASNKITTVYSPSRPWIIYTFDWFDNPGNDPNNPLPVETRMQSLLTRLQVPLQFRLARNVPVMPEQYGSHYGADNDRTVLAFSISTLLANRMPGLQWEMRAPYVGPTIPLNSQTFGWIWNRGDGVDAIRVTDENLMKAAAAQYAALAGLGNLNNIFGVPALNVAYINRRPKNTVVSIDGVPI